MNSNLKSLLTSAGLIFFYVFATIGIVKLFWNTDSEERFQGRVVFLSLSSFTLSLFYVIGIYHIVGSHNVDMFYKAFIILQVMYCIIGLYGYVAINNNK